MPNKVMDYVMVGLLIIAILLFLYVIYSGAKP